MEDDKDKFFNEHNLRMKKMKREEVEAMLRTFLKRMANMKLIMTVFNDEVDICPRCFASDAKGAEEYEGAEYQKEGKPAKKPPLKARKSSLSPGSQPKSKKAKVDNGSPESQPKGRRAKVDGDGSPASEPKRKSKKATVQEQGKDM